VVRSLAAAGSHDQATGGKNRARDDFEQGFVVDQRVRPIDVEPVASLNFAEDSCARHVRRSFADRDTAAAICTSGSELAWQDCRLLPAKPHTCPKLTDVLGHIGSRVGCRLGSSGFAVVTHGRRRSLRCGAEIALANRTIGRPIDEGWAMRTSASLDPLSPCAWKLPITAPDHYADSCTGLSGVLPPTAWR